MKEIITSLTVTQQLFDVILSVFTSPEIYAMQMNLFHLSLKEERGSHENHHV